MPDAPAPGQVLVPCPRCGHKVVLGQTAGGEIVAVETQRQMYTLVWHQGEPYPRLRPSRGYPTHQCGG